MTMKTIPVDFFCVFINGFWLIVRTTKVDAVVLKLRSLVIRLIAEQALLRAQRAGGEDHSENLQQSLY
jgi:hypothetical protein